MADSVPALFERIHARHNRAGDKAAPVRLAKWTFQTLLMRWGVASCVGAELGVREDWER